jgi:hypothetical protein
MTHDLLIRAAQHLNLHVYCDADWAGCPDDERSTLESDYTKTECKAVM